MGPMTNRVKVRIYFYGLTIEINNFAFEVKVILGMESTIPDVVGLVGLVGWMGFS